MPPPNPNGNDSRLIQAARTAKFIKSRMWSGMWNGGGIYAGFYLAFNDKHELSQSILGLFILVVSVLAFKYSLRYIDEKFTGQTK